MGPVMITVRTLGPGDEAVVAAAAKLFEHPPTPAWTTEFLTSAGHHLLFAFDGDHAIGFASCVEMAHPDKGRELFLYELGVAEHAREQGVGRSLVDACLDLARSLGCYGAWTVTEGGNEAAKATYEAAGAVAEPETVTAVWHWG